MSDVQETLQSDRTGDISRLRLYNPQHIMVKTQVPEGYRAQGLIYLTLDSKVPKFKGEVIQLGRDVIDIDLGDIVYFQRHAGARITPDTAPDEVLVLNYNDLHGARNDMELRPLADRVIVEEIQAGDTTESGIALPQTHDERVRRGRVLAVGPGRIQEDGTRSPMRVSVGDTIMYSLWSGTDVKHGDTKYTFVKESEILVTC